MAPAGAEKHANMLDKLSNPFCGKEGVSGVVPVVDVLLLTELKLVVLAVDECNTAPWSGCQDSCDATKGLHLSLHHTWQIHAALLCPEVLVLVLGMGKLVLLTTTANYVKSFGLLLVSV